MAEGSYTVGLDPEDKRGILFRLKSGSTMPIPEDQEVLHIEVEKTIAILKMVFPSEDDKRFWYYYTSILSLAQVGLVANPAQPQTSMKALAALKEEVVLQEGSGIKNTYMKKLGKIAIKFSAPVIILAVLIRIIIYYSILDADVALESCFHFTILWIGCMVGTWLSFGIRKPSLKFEDLAMVEDDQLEPTVRLIFVGLLTMSLGVLFLTNALSLTFGGLSSDNFGKDIYSSLAIGILCGIAEKVLPSRLAQTAKHFVEK